MKHTTLPAQEAQARISSNMPSFEALHTALLKHTLAHCHNGRLSDAFCDYDESEHRLFHVNGSRRHRDIPLEPGAFATLCSQLATTHESPGLLTHLGRRLQRALHVLSTLPRPFFNFRFKRVAAYHFFAGLGSVMGLAALIFMTFALKLSLVTVSLTLLTAVLVTYLYVKGVQRYTKKGSVVLFHYTAALFAGEYILLLLLNEPVLPYLEILFHAFGIVIAYTRIGCFMAGCCYGKPSRFGITYNKHHTRNGFPPLMRNVHLVPIQLVESAWLFLITGVSMYITFTHEQAGSGLATQLVLLSAGRYCFEFLRGDITRPYFRGFSRAQWTSMGVLLLVIGLEWAGTLPAQVWHIAVASFVFFTAIHDRLAPENMLNNCIYAAAHLHELARTFDIFAKGSIIPVSSHRAVHVRKTRCGIQLSESTVDIGGQSYRQVTMSSVHAAASFDPVALFGILQNWSSQDQPFIVISSGPSIYHMISIQDPNVRV